MAKVIHLLSICHKFMLVLLTSLICAHADEERKVYIVYMGALPRDPLYTPSTHHISLLQKITGQSFSEELIVRTFKRSFNGFAAKLTRNEAEELSRAEDVVSVFPERNYELDTTRSWDFLGFSEAHQPPESQNDIIIGVIDSGIWPELETFSGEDFGPPPKKWKGVCAGGQNFTCNNKVIGARYYGPLKTARDEDGHGTHCASVAAGVPVDDISFYGLAQGTVRGGAPSARIAVYRVCIAIDCSNMDIMHAFDDAITDGVDIISISMSTARIPIPFDEDVIAVGAFHAMAKGIVTSNSAGNTGKTIGIKSNAPWMISVAASTKDRRIINNVVLGNGMALEGNSIQTFDLQGATYPLVGIFWFRSYNGKIIVDRETNSLYAASQSAVGAIYTSSRGNFSKVEPVPAALLSSSDFDVVSSYMKSSEAPIATITTSEEIKDHSAPVVAPFSARGPNSYLQEIMKPDVTAPGVAILAGYSPIASIAESSDDKRRVKYNILSGTSMACPHVSAIAAYIKSFHPHWSPSAIQSAIMTTAIPLNDTTNPDGVLAYGSGQINPLKATDPGLVYEATEQDYVKLLCRNGYNKYRLRMITGDYNTNCSSGANQNLVFDFNYPALTAKVEPDTSFTIVFRRTVTNVGRANSTYYATVLAHSDFQLILEPPVLFFHSLNQKISFSITIIGKGLPVNSFKSSALEWIDGPHVVRIPILVHTITPKLR